MPRKKVIFVKDTIERQTQLEKRAAVEQAEVEAKAEAYLAGTVKLRILRDGVFPFADIRRDTGDECVATEEVAKLLIERGHAKRL